MIIRTLKKIAFKLKCRYWRVIYFFKYNIPLTDIDLRSVNTKSALKIFEGASSVAVVGKGASIFENNPINIIQKCDRKCLLSRVDVENLKEYIGDTFDVQVTSYVSLIDTMMPVLPYNLINKLGIRTLLCNTPIDSPRFQIYCRFFHNRVKYISGMPLNTELSYLPDIYKYSKEGRLTMASSVLKILYNVPSVSKIYFAGVDAYHFGYSQKAKEDGKIFFEVTKTTNDPKQTHGIPFLNFLFETVIERNEIYPLTVYFPEVLRELIPFPDHPSFQFYK